MPTTPPDPPPIRPVPPELLAWARQTLDIEDFIKQVREIERDGGHSLESVIREIEAESNEPTS